MKPKKEQCNVKNPELIQVLCPHVSLYIISIQYMFENVHTHSFHLFAMKLILSAETQGCLSSHLILVTNKKRLVVTRMLQKCEQQINLLKPVKFELERIKK